ncbi:uncharacterized protein LOC119073823 [Bradysia coprophila]|uniref:uncharacterized protein LOC119073823 n=1 Tax=Bradysia coprophila TaxID=38358 RepID=UPI00187DC503|nr:uncharacterized protein LOC119073823 [Bradysia coprophila]
MKNDITIFFFVSVISSTALALKLTCRYKTETDWWTKKDVYFCDLKYGVETLKPQDVITAVNGYHLEDKSNADVVGFRANKKPLAYFPKGLRNYFDAEKIEFIAVWETGLKEIHQSDLSPFTKLRILSLWVNDVEVIERDLLKFNPHLEYIGLGKNKIKFVDGNVFGHLNALHSLYIDDNKCISTQVTDNREAVVDLLQEIQEKCSGSNGRAPGADSNFELTCRYETETDWWAINNVYFCDLQYGVQTLKLKDVITAVNGYHLDDKCNADVVGFRANKKPLAYFPKGLRNYFDAEKIEFIAVWETGLKEIHQSDLSPFTKLRILSLWVNDVEVIERDLLKFNPHLEYIGLGKNKIKFVDGNVFGHLNALHSLYIDDNKCISTQVTDNREAVVDLLQEIQEKCSGSNGGAPGADSNFELTCRYETETDWWAINKVYFCDLQYGVETLKLKDVITAVNGDHLYDRSNADVVGFRASKRRLQYFPKGLANYFDADKIEFIAVWETGLKEIHQSDLSPFTKLRILSLWINDVEVIERDLLKFNPHLEYIGLGKNKIKFVDGNVFGHLNALRSLYIDDNMCISRQVADNREAVVDLLQEIQQRCSGSNGTAPAGDSNFEITCRYETETDWWAINNVYFCDLQYGVETLKLEDVITAVNGDHLDDRSNADVVGFRASKRRLEYFPKGLANYFDADKIEFIAVWETGLKEIHQSDLSPFTKLRILSLWINDVEVIERDLLKFNPHLEYIGLGKNKIKFVDGNVFGHLNALRSLYIDDNMCISRQVADNREAVVDLLQEIQEKCSGSNGTAPGGDSNLELTCRYDTETDWWAIDDVYFCDLQYGVETLKLKDVITAVNGDHLDDRSNADVVGFRASKRRLEYFPKGLANYFDADKIEFIAVWETGLKVIHQSDLSPFTKLRILSLWINDVEVIERDLLKFNPHLEYIGLGKNKIKFVDGNVFGHLNALHSLYIDDNKCISRQVADNREAVVDLLQELQQKCSDSYGTAPGGDSNFEITCRYETETDWWAINNVYFCDLQYGVETLKLKDVITAVNGDHLDDRSNADVVGFRASKRRLEYFPKGLANYFDAEKIEFIAVWETGLKEIHQSDLSLFTKLRILSLWINDVEVIEHDLLKFNTHLEYIGLGKNKIKFVDGNVFGHLNALHSLYIDDNKCISRQVADNREAVVDLLQEIQQKCSGYNGTAPGGDSNFEITCRYVTETDWWAINNVYFCDLQYGVETLKLKDVITAVNGDHLYDRSNADVVGFRASKRRLEYFPKGLANYFDAEKIEFIAVWETGLKVIHQSNLSPFTKLRILSLWINDVEVIERDLLKFNPHLEYIGLGKNKIKFVDGNVFGHLNALHSLYIDDNKCISRQVADNREAIVDLLQEIQQKCSGYNGTAPRGHSNLDIRK